MRPAITEIRTITVASPSRHPSPDGTATPSASRCISRLAIPRTPTGATIGKLRQFRPTTISRATTPTSTTGKDRSAAMAIHAGTSAESRQAMRPSSHNPASSASGLPLTGSRPVQFGIAVSRKPAIAAITKPNSISWICQASGSNRLGTVVPVANMTIQTRERHRRPETRRQKEGPEALGEKCGHRVTTRMSASQVRRHGHSLSEGRHRSQPMR